jgi:hypothetical protein
MQHVPIHQLSAFSYSAHTHTAHSISVPKVEKSLPHLLSSSSSSVSQKPVTPPKAVTLTYQKHKVLQASPLLNFDTTELQMREVLSIHIGQAGVQAGNVGLALVQVWMIMTTSITSSNHVTYSLLNRAAGSFTASSTVSIRQNHRRRRRLLQHLLL